MSRDKKFFKLVVCAATVLGFFGACAKTSSDSSDVSADRSVRLDVDGQDVIRIRKIDSVAQSVSGGMWLNVDFASIDFELISVNLQLRSDKVLIAVPNSQKAGCLQIALNQQILQTQVNKLALQINFSGLKARLNENGVLILNLEDVSGCSSRSPQ